MSDTIEVHGEEYDAEDAQEALDALPNGDVVRDYAMAGDVLIVGDGDTDDYVQFADANEATGVANGSVVGAQTSDIITVRNVESKVEDALTKDFADFVEDEFFSIEAVDGETYSEGYDGEFTGGQDRATIGSATMRDIQNSDDVEIGYITYSDGEKAVGDTFGTIEDPKEEAEIRIALKDKRDE